MTKPTGNPRGRPSTLPLDRVDARTNFMPNGCWVLTGHLQPNGYAMIRIGGKDLYVHRWSHEFFIGPIPAGYEVDHVKTRGCTNKACWNPAHLEAVTPEENIRRG